MFKNYVKIAMRNLLRYKGYSFINVAGLVLGMTCCLLLFQYVAYEVSYDRFNSKQDRLFRATFASKQNGEDRGYQGTTAYMFGPTVAREVPGIVRFTRVHLNYGDAVLSYKSAGENRVYTEKNVLFVDTTFFSMFDYSLVRGDLRTILRTPSTMVLSESMARKYFGAEDPIGKPIDFTGWVRGTYTVTGIFKDVPPTSHIQFDFLLPVEDLLKNPQYTSEGADWGWTNFITYFETNPGADVASLERNITKTFYRYQGDDLASTKSSVEAHLQPLLDIHLNADIQAPASVLGNRRTVYFFTLIGLITLVIALVNYVNLATARAMTRVREVGVRKVVGARKLQLIGQFLMESALVNLVALFLAIGLSVLLLPVVNRLAGVRMTGALWLDVRFWGVILGVFGIGAVLSGMYPAFILSSFQPISVLKGKVGSFASRVVLRKALVVVQFAASILLLAGTGIVYSQLNHMRSMDVGFNLEQILVIQGPRVGPEGADPVLAMNAFKSEIKKLPAVKDVALSNTTPGGGFNWYTRMYRASADPSTGEDARATSIDHEFMRLYGMKMAAGEPFVENARSPQDTTAFRVLVNEAMVKAVGFPSNDAAIGQGISAGSGPAFIVQGVVKDFNWSSAHQKAEAVLFFYEPAGGRISIKVNTQGLQQSLARMKTIYQEIFPGNPFEYTFADETFDQQYKTDERFASMVGMFAGIAILIACLGLFGLAAFTAQQRTKEIGVRKVLGASVTNIVALLSRDFLLLVLVAFAVAVPVSYFIMKKWLDTFAYHITPGLGIYLLAGFTAILIALATVSVQSIRAAHVDPVKSLRYE